MKKIIAFVISIMLIAALVSCSSSGTTSGTSTKTTNNSSGNTAATTTSVQVEGIAASDIAVDFHSDDLDESDNSADTTIELNGSSISVEGDGAEVSGSTVTITSAGNYSISGTLTDGQIIVQSEDDDTVKLILNGIDITCSDSAPIYIPDAKKVVITLAAGSENYVTDGSAYEFEDEESDEPNAAIFSKSDLTINGDGSLTVNANYNNGIASKDELKIVNGNITVNAVNDGIKGRDYIAISGGTITVDADGDGMQSNNDEDTEKGFVFISGGTFNITAGTDGIQAETSMLITGGDLYITTGGGSGNSSTGENWGTWGQAKPGNLTTTETDTPSAKGLKAGVDVFIAGGNIEIDSSDDSIHTNGTLTIEDGEFNLTSGDDGMHADTSLTINEGEINITKSYEGIESATVTINGGIIYVTTSDDGINVAGGNDQSAMGGRPGQNTFSNTGSQLLSINGGYLVVNASGDGLDSNGSIEMTGGTVIVSGPTNSANGSLDYMGTFNLTGGTLIAAGSSGMAQTVSNSSTQYTVMVKLDSALQAGTIFHVETSSGEEILTISPLKSYQCVVFSLPELENGETYAVYTGGTSSGTLTDMVYSGGSYTGGTQFTTITISGIVTNYGAAGGMVPGAGTAPTGGGMPGGGRPGQR